MTTVDPEFARYSRQVLCTQIGPEGQRALKLASVTLVGCGALGSALANILVRGGVGHVQLIDRDFIETDNLQRQTLFDEHDIADSLPKAEAAARKLRRINSAVEVDAVVTDLNRDNIMELCRDADLLLDGTDNVETRFLLNDLAVKLALPWVYGACIGVEGRVMAVVPHQTPCLRCIWDEPPPAGTLATCDTVGVLASTVNVVASLQAVEATKILTGQFDGLAGLVTTDVWTGRSHAVRHQAARDEGDCACCKQGRYEFLEGDRLPATTPLCGRDAVQIVPPAPQELDLRRIAQRIPAVHRPRHSAHLLRFNVEQVTVALFADGRAIVKGTSDPTVARAVLAKFVGS